MKYTPVNGTPVTSCTIAVDRRFSKVGQREADFIPVVIWGKMAETTAQYSAKGKLIALSGKLQTRSYETKDGNRRYVTEVTADEVQFIEWADGSNKKISQEVLNNYPDIEIDEEGDLPF